jgi:hypothetical protein
MTCSCTSVKPHLVESPRQRENKIAVDSDTTGQDHPVLARHVTATLVMVQGAPCTVTP